MSPVPIAPATRFWAKVRKTRRCWLWTAGRAGSKAYGCFHDGKKQVRAHRWAWENLKGPIPPGKLVLHKCDNVICVKPAHLFIGTYMDNRADMLRKNRANQPTGASHWARRLPERVSRGEVQSLAVKLGWETRRKNNSMRGRSNGESTSSKIK